LDIGTSKIAAVAFDRERGENLAVVSAVNSATTEGSVRGLHEQEPGKIYGSCLDLLRRLLLSGEFAPEDVGAVALSGQMHGVLLADCALVPVTKLVTWCDQRAVAFAASLDRATWPSDRSGCYLHPGYGGATLAVLAAEGKIPSGTVALSIADFVAARLSGVVATEPSLAASWGIMDLREGSWDEELLARLSIPKAILPEIRTGSRLLGPLRAELGLPDTVAVFSPIGDNQASYYGACGLDSPALLLNLGTGGQISLPCGDLTFRPELETRPLPLGGYLLVGSSLCGGRSYALLKDFFRSVLNEFAGLDIGDDLLYGVMNRLAASASDAPTVDTRFAGARMDRAARGSIGDIGIENFTPAAFCRGLVLGMVRELTRMIPPGMEKSFDRVLGSGNAIRGNPQVRSIISAELGLPCESSVNQEEAATGAALLAARSLKSR
jgi:sedoheptulokinase